MSSKPVTVKVSSRSPKRPIKKLPSTLEITPSTTVQEVKETLAKPGRWDPERFGIYGTDNKLIRDRKARIIDYVKGGEEISAFKSPGGRFLSLSISDRSLYTLRGPFY
ncbi:hypothetical protein DH86_00003703, partial [Scytalidium sp. 3C]